MVSIKNIDHVGIRVHDLTRSLEFYKLLGFKLEIDHGDNRAYEIVNDDNVRINLIVNASYASAGENILLDSKIKHPGYTHAAFVVKDLNQFIESEKFKAIEITEGPKEVDRRRYLFIRDPDGNVIEFNELL